MTLARMIRGRYHRVRLHLRHGRQLGAPDHDRTHCAHRTGQALSRLPRRRAALPTRGCGSFSGYYDFLDAIAGPDKGKGSRRKREMLTWYGGPYNPNDTDENLIRANLKRVAKTARRGKATTVDPGSARPSADAYDDTASALTHDRPPRRLRQEVSDAKMTIS